jgi:SAM-dependent methyltransferase
MSQNSDTVFSDEQFSIMFPPGSGNHYWNLTKKRVVENVLSKLAPAGILDVGAGVGIEVSYLKSRDFRVWGTELAKVPVPEDIRDVFFTGKNISELPADVRNQIDTILLLDVVEHIEDPRVLISEAARSLPNLRTIVITVPARQELWSNLDVFNNHFIRYDRPTLSRVMSEVGWKPVYSGYYFHALYWPALLIAKLGLSRSVRLYGPKGLGVFIHRLIAAILYIDYLCISRFIVGSSIVAVFKKNS